MTAHAHNSDALLRAQAAAIQAGEGRKEPKAGRARGGALILAQRPGDHVRHHLVCDRSLIRARQPSGVAAQGRNLALDGLLWMPVFPHAQAHLLQ